MYVHTANTNGTKKLINSQTAAGNKGGEHTATTFVGPHKMHRHNTMRTTAAPGHFGDTVPRVVQGWLGVGMGRGWGVRAWGEGG